MAQKMKPTLLLRLWFGLTRMVPGLFDALIRRAHLRQGADPARLGERFGRASVNRPDGQLIWIHAASVGEVISVSALARLIAAQTKAQILITTTTATGAKTAAARLPDALHQFLPIDTPAAVNRFFIHWRPDAALFVEADLWPRLLRRLAAQSVPRALLNARPSKTRKRAPRSMRVLLHDFSLITVQDVTLVQEFIDLGLASTRINAPGNLKADIPPPRVDEALAQQFRAAATRRPIWAAASTHPGEEEIILDAFGAMVRDSLLILVPRHPERGDAIAAELIRRGIVFSRQSAATRPAPETQVHLLDTIGDLGTVYRVADLAVIGGSLLDGIGGHTPYEPAQLGCAVLSGPYVENFRTAYDTLCASGAVITVRNGPELTANISRLLSDQTTLKTMRASALAEQARHVGATGRTFSLLSPLLSPSSPPVPGPDRGAAHD
ncbi:3-deoxy-D-manno-octulosonic-acid transferase [Roseinatronobacter thiooxidans]|uniref:3-deoxy-D-manno-octulosonic acid transferase n=2 Tax=Roseinatronobacter thiooxidans TaxID=121821 RepID=A0A2W7QE70_9RHOB|nr:3-deoxy-D-manno-octulosonic-acid transferase [Roseinatronobacter thiooxidans]